MTSPASAGSRFAGVDAFRGLVMLVLVSNQLQGFSFLEISQRHPQSALWAFLARQFTHTAWGGATVWDFIMPSFVFLIGVSMRLSYESRRARGEGAAAIALHVALRCVAMFLLGMLLVVQINTPLSLWWPVLMLLPGVHIDRQLPSWAESASAQVRQRLATWFLTVVLCASAWRLAGQIHELGNYDFSHLLTQVAFAYPFAYIAGRLSVRGQAIAITAILIAYWLAFALYPATPFVHGGLPMPVQPEVTPYQGWFAHWNRDSNVAAAFDRWFLNALPRTATFVANEHGYQTLSFVPLIASMLLGSIAAVPLRNAVSPQQACVTLLKLGVAWLVAGLATSFFLCPLVKSMWTPSWVLFSGGVAALLLALFHYLASALMHKQVIYALAVAGTNSLLLYVLSMNFRPMFLYKWQHLLGWQFFDGPYGPLLFALCMVATMWVIAAVLSKLRIFVRL